MSCSLLLNLLSLSFIELLILNTDTLSNNSEAILPATFGPIPSALDNIVLSPDEIAKTTSSTDKVESKDNAALGPTPWTDCNNLKKVWSEELTKPYITILSSFICKSVNRDKLEPISPKEEINLEETFNKYPIPFTSSIISDLPIDVNTPFKEAIISILHFKTL